MRLENVNSLGVTPNGVIGVLTAKRGFIKPKKKSIAERLAEIDEESFAPEGASICYGGVIFTKEESVWISSDGDFDDRHAKVCESLWLAGSTDFSKLSIPSKKKREIKDLEIEILVCSEKLKSKKQDLLIGRKYNLLETDDKTKREAVDLCG